MTIAERTELIINFIEIEKTEQGYRLPFSTPELCNPCHFQIPEMRFHNDWNWMIFALKRANNYLKYADFSFSIDKEVYDVFVNFSDMINHLKQYGYDNKRRD